MRFHNNISSLSSDYYRLDNVLIGNLAGFVSRSSKQSKREIFSQAVHCLSFYKNREMKYLCYSAFQGLMVLVLILIDIVYTFSYSYVKNPGEFLLIFNLNLELAQTSWFLLAKIDHFVICKKRAISNILF